MNHFSKVLVTIGLAVSLLTGLYPATDIAMSATAPNVSVLPAVTSGISTPARLATDSSGNIYATDPYGRGLLKYNSAGSLLQKIFLPKSGTGIAISPNGNLLVTQVNYVAVLNPADGTEISRFGSFTYANGIAVDPGNNVYVTDSKQDNVRKFSYSSGTNSYSLVATSTDADLYLLSPTGIAYDKSSGQLLIANSLVGTIELANPADLTWNDTIGNQGYDPHPAYPAYPLFTNPQGVALEYNSQNGTLARIYVAESYQANIQVLDGATYARIADIGGYGFTNGKLFVPLDVMVDQFSPSNKRLFVANGGGTLTVFGIDNMQPTNIQVGSATVSSLTVSWTNPVDPTFSRIRVYRSSVAGQLGTQVGGDLINKTNYTDTGLTSGTTYYYTVRAVTTSNAELANTQPVAGTTRINYTLTLTTVGAGTINGTASCGENTTCQAQILDNTLVTLTAVPNALSSVFTGWSGACTGSSEVCQVTMTAAKGVTATFAAQSPIKVDGNYFVNLQEAYNAAKDGSVIMIMAGTWAANSVGSIMTADRPITVILEGGYSSEFTNAPAMGDSKISSRINVQAGKVIMNNVKLR